MRHGKSNSSEREISFPGKTQIFIKKTNQDWYSTVQYVFQVCIVILGESNKL